jgi:hypothetical protein
MIVTRIALKKLQRNGPAALGIAEEKRRAASEPISTRAPPEAISKATKSSSHVIPAEQQRTRLQHSARLLSIEAIQQRCH